MTKKIYILYHPGTYGSYLRWLIEYGNDVGHRYKTIPDSLEMNDGSAHYNDYYNKHPKGLDILKTLDDSPSYDWGYIIYRAIPINSTSNKNTNFIIENLLNSVRDIDKIIYIDVDTDFLKEITFINSELKIPYKEYFDLTHLLKNWGIENTNFYKTDKWIQREVLSLWFRGMINSLTNRPDRFNKVLYINMHDILFSDSSNLAKQLINFCELPFNENSVNRIKLVQKEFFYKQKALVYHQNMCDVLKNCLNQTDSIIGEMSLFTEAILQEQLLANGYSLKCYGLNELPKTTGELLKLLEKC